MKKRVLVFPCGSEIGLEIYKSVSFSTHFELYGGSSVDDHGKFVYKNYIAGLPNVEDEDFCKKLNEVIEKYDIDYVFPAHDSVVLSLAIEKSRGNLNCDVITSPVDTCQTARSKRSTYRALEDAIATPRVYDETDLTDRVFPVFLKPDVGQGSKGVYKANDIEDVRFYRNKDHSLMLLEYLPGREYTIDCFTDRHGELRFCKGRERRRVSNGISVNSVRVHKQEFERIANKINEKLSFRGTWFFQLKERSSGELVLLEIAPRVAGTMGLTRGMGVNLPLLSLFDASGMDVSIAENTYMLEIDRALENKFKHDIDYSHLYIDFDDLVIVSGKINPHAVALIIQSINNDVKVHLLTRHPDDLQVTLAKHRLTGLFDEVIWLKAGEKKSDHIKEKEAIFIDDSFSERNEVQEAKGIPVFDAHMLESLIE